MKKVKVKASLLFMLLSVGMFAQNVTDKLPKNAQDFISQHFSSASVAEVKENSRWQIWEDEKFDVRLTNGIELDFDKNGKVLEIDTNGNEVIPKAVLSTAINSYLEANYPDAQVISWDIQDDGQEIELMNGIEIEFDKIGNFKKID